MKPETRTPKIRRKGTIRMSYVDLHLHLLPGVDDGPPDEAASLTHAARLVAAGVHEATVTPHVGHPQFPLDVATIPERTVALQSALDRAGLALRIHPGGEIHPDGAMRLEHEDLDLIAHGPSGARWVLLEVPFPGIDEHFLQACRRVRDEGFGILIAHPERAHGLLSGGLARLRGELAAGAVLQVSVCSLLGRHGGEARAAAVHLVSSGLTYVIASDGHGGRRAHTLGEGLPLARAAGASAVGARQLTAANPTLLLRAGIAELATPSRRAAAWHSPHEPLVAAARVAARRTRATPTRT